MRKNVEDPCKVPRENVLNEDNKLLWLALNNIHFSSLSTSQFLQFIIAIILLLAISAASPSSSQNHTKNLTL